jgi:DNA-binding NarL/FixJ family response regulator
MAAAVMLSRARTASVIPPRPGPRTRMRTRAGRWLVCHASYLRGADGGPGKTALVIEPAKASEITPIVVRAYQLSRREQQITRLISYGYDTAAIAQRLHLSTHTVRDYVKAIFEKVGVSSRGELVARLFAEHYTPTRLEDPSNAV